MTGTRIRLATASPATQGTTAATLAQLERIAGRAAGADVLVLPEAYLGGYPRGADFGCRVGSRTAVGRDDFLAYFRGAVDLGDGVGEGGGGDGDAWLARRADADAEEGGAAPAKRGDGTREQLERIARESGLFLVVGLVERAGGSLYCAVVYVCPRLGVVGKRRKVQPTGTERLIWAQGSPATLKAVSTVIRGVRINLAAAICWENYMPLLRQSLYAQNVNLYLAPTADGRDTWLPLMRTVALEGRCFVVSSNMCVRGGTPTASATPGKPKGAARGRRRSVFDEDGNEIALPVRGTDEPAAAGAAVIEEGEEGGGDAAAAAAAPEEEPPAVAQTQAVPEGFLSRGGSCIVSPAGDVLAGPQWEDDEGIVYADVDFEDCVRGRLDLDAAGSYSRNDSFKLSVTGLDLEPLPYY
ncbi:carbon-nitrogen hydrolase [Durotheca rogersii]|uniref:carbon-nitrogen hydrolase n=1 Tax=Durotheca rogersii TaxID=419775 RepID=UPI00221F9484|nr:carbon-nitrogen hydrolase [Durotheca rogersii]KAI5864069.1 carbon-nitrogen hydrolase [Durotheca rogersii]